MQNLNKSRILFVDDEPEILRSLERITKKLDAVILTASSGQDALDIINECPVDVIVSDFNMPNMDGNQLLEQVAKISPETVRMVLTGHGDMEMIVNLCIHASNKAHLVKPLSLSQGQVAQAKKLQHKRFIG